MDRKFARDAAKAHRVEVQAQRKEAHLHTRAVNAVVHGRLGKAAVLETRANNQAIRAERAHHREQVASIAAVTAPTTGCHHRHRHPRYPHQPRVAMVVTGRHPGNPIMSGGYPGNIGTVTVTQTTYSPPQPVSMTTPYPVGMQAPPSYNPAYPQGPPPPYTVHAVADTTENRVDKFLPGW